jgi:ATP/maltotriose-dependent transcriptional regulator MalT
VAGDAPIDPAITRQLLASLLQQLPQKNNITAVVESEIELTNREKQILQLVAESLSNQQIAAQLYLSRHTVDSHVKHIYRKLEVTKRMQAVITARNLGLL